MRSFQGVWSFFAFAILGLNMILSKEIFAQVQDFESNFRIVNHPEEFLPFWSANDLRSTASRIFQANGEGRNGSRALAAQPIASFDGEIFVKISPENYIEPKIAFFGKSKQNGSGSRFTTVFVSFSRDEISYSIPVAVGNVESFPNFDTDFKLYEVFVPEEFAEDISVTVKFDIKYGAGTGSSARFFMDDFGVFDGSEQVDPIQVRRAYLLNPFEILLQFDRDVASFGQNQIQVNHPNLQSVSFPKNDIIILSFESSLPEKLLEIQFDRISDTFGNVTELLSTTIDNSTIRLGEILILSPNELMLSFSQFYDPVSASISSQYRINGLTPSFLEIQENGFSVKLGISNTLSLNEQVLVTAREIKNENLLLGMPDEQMIFYIDGIREIFAIAEDRLILSHEYSLDLDSFDQKDFSLEDSDFIFSIEESNDQNLVLIPSKAFEENINYVLTIPPRINSRGLQYHGSKRDFEWDATPPTIDQILAVSSNEVLILFSEQIDAVFTSNVNNFSIEGIQPIHIRNQENGYSFVLTWPFEFSIGNNYSLHVFQAVDLAGNFSGELIIDFVFERPQGLGFKSVVINEVMAAPRAGNTLPNVEYVELFNRSEAAIDLGGFQLTNSRRSASISSEILLPGEYIILCPRTQAAQFRVFGKVVGLTNWPTLINSGDQIKLWDTNGVIIDSLNYTTASYRGSAFASGGYSLEIINPWIDCNLSTNISPSTSPSRGTPGKVNAVFDETPDRSKPKIDNVIVLDSNRILIYFTKIISSALQGIVLDLEPPLTLLTMEIAIDQKSLILTFSENLKEGVSYKGKLAGLRDCVGNELHADDRQFRFVIPSKAEAGDVSINEVLFNARTGAPKFVEIYNKSNKYIDLQDWKLANLNTDGIIANRRVVSTQHLIIPPYSFMVFTTDAERLFQEYPKGDHKVFVNLNSLPSYPQSQGNVVWLDPLEDFPEIFSYSERMHHRLLREPRGVSLERLSVDMPIDQSDNWQSASASIGHASPGIRNSNTFENIQQFGIEVYPKVFVPDAVGEQPFTTISYKVASPGMLATVRIFSTAGNLVREICQNEIWGMEGFYTWDGTDTSGTKVRPGHYVIWIEIYDLSGKVNQTKKTVVVGSKIR
ncbi:lamin tail domain-containing protein [Belliella kenyensis]|uniref:Lamin tail domain-containing protein n=1 Tax=Belliella kenyensis TaxID=1472724 RepID=A0ABV8EM69_9BACT|nr:lamin tail domain-containing protein [Belliella kenyensis]MCH7401461.1 lamin tail domain-containing protein [Belliella kenyensis]MDN3603258.1 lamin tail domain-containing protein [Belliella kenyensis]